MKKVLGVVIWMLANFVGSGLSFAASLPPATKPVSVEVFAYCETKTCKVSVVLRNKTAMSIELSHHLYDDKTISNSVLEFYLAEDYYSGKFEHPIRITGGGTSRLDQNMTFSPLEVKSYILTVDKKALNLTADKEYVVLFAAINTEVLVGGSTITRLTMLSDPGFLVGKGVMN
ncbi:MULTISPECIES: hypothetical protein [Pseudoalteromonas]|uniref:hypothetical protein n=1 Tax=Pseudoalteromonas TaxID=53246 RepID=UPI000F7A4069|nr:MULTISPECIES: hypothetical protein [Pseudoalteromonas]